VADAIDLVTDLAMGAALSLVGKTELLRRVAMPLETLRGRLAAEDASYRVGYTAGMLSAARGLTDRLGGVMDLIDAPPATVRIVGREDFYGQQSGASLDALHEIRDGMERGG